MKQCIVLVFLLCTPALTQEASQSSEIAALKARVKVLEETVESQRESIKVLHEYCNFNAKTVTDLIRDLTKKENERNGDKK